jgi:hypothetical protein
MPAVTHPVQGRPLGLDPSGTANASIVSARNALRHRIRDGYPDQDTNPIPFNMVRLEELTDQIPAVSTPTQTVFQVRFDDVPTGRYMTVQIVPGTLMAYVDGTWTPVDPVVDADINGVFTIPNAPQTQLLVTYAYQYLADGELDQFIDESRQWLREFLSVDMVPDGLVPALVSYAASRALYALARSATLAPVKAGDSDVDYSQLGKQYTVEAAAQYKMAQDERAAFYTQGPEALDPTVVDVGSVHIDPYTPLN